MKNLVLPHLNFDHIRKFKFAVLDSTFKFQTIFVRDFLLQRYQTKNIRENRY